MQLKYVIWLNWITNNYSNLQPKTANKSISKLRIRVKQWNCDSCSISVWLPVIAWLCGDVIASLPCVTRDARGPIWQRRCDGAESESRQMWRDRTPSQLSPAKLAFVLLCLLIPFFSSPTLPPPPLPFSFYFSYLLLFPTLFVFYLSCTSSSSLLITFVLEWRTHVHSDVHVHSDLTPSPVISVSINIVKSKQFFLLYLKVCLK